MGYEYTGIAYERRGDMLAARRHHYVELDGPRLVGRAVVGRVGRSSGVYRRYPPAHGRPSRVVLGHDLTHGLAGVAQLDDLPLETVAEMPRVLGVCHGFLRSKWPSRNCPA